MNKKVNTEFVVEKIIKNPNNNEYTMKETVTITAAAGSMDTGAFTSRIAIPFTPKKMILRQFALSIPSQTAAPTNRVLLLRCPAITNRTPNLLAFCIDVNYSLLAAAPGQDYVDLSYTLTTETEFEINNNIQGTLTFSLVNVNGGSPTGVTWTNSECAIVMEFQD